MFLFRSFTGTFVYKLDSRTKLLIILLFSVLAFLVNSLFTAAFLLLIFTIIRLVVKIPFRGTGYFKHLSLLALFIVLIQTLFFPGDNYIVNPIFPHSFPVLGGMGSLKWEGLMFGITVTCRLAALMIIFPVFTETTSPDSLAVGLNSLGFNYITAYIITTTFNLIPFFGEKAKTIMDAQRLRGMDSMEKGSFFSRLKVYSGLSLPLVLGAMRKAQISSVAMDSRAFGVYKTRTWLDKPSMKAADFFSILACFVFSAVVLFFNYSKGIGLCLGK